MYYYYYQTCQTPDIIVKLIKKDNSLISVWSIYSYFFKNFYLVTNAFDPSHKEALPHRDIIKLAELPVTNGTPCMSINTFVLNRNKKTDIRVYNVRLKNISRKSN